MQHNEKHHLNKWIRVKYLIVRHASILEHRYHMIDPRETCNHHMETMLSALTRRVKTCYETNKIINNKNGHYYQLMLRCLRADLSKTCYATNKIINNKNGHYY